MPDIKVVCPSCSRLLKLANPSLVGKKVRCPMCQGVVPVPADAAPRVRHARRAAQWHRTPSRNERPAPRRKMAPVAAPRAARQQNRRGPDRAVVGVPRAWRGRRGSAGYFAWDWYNKPAGDARPSSSNPPTKPTPGGAQTADFSTPDGALDSYVKALRDV